MFSYYHWPIMVAYKDWESRSANPLGNKDWFTVASENDYRFVQQKETKSDRHRVIRMRHDNIYVQINSNDTIQSIKYYKETKHGGVWRTIVGRGSTEEDRKIVERARKLWREELNKKRKRG